LPVFRVRTILRLKASDDHPEHDNFLATVARIDENIVPPAFVPLSTVASQPAFKLPASGRQRFNRGIFPHLQRDTASCARSTNGARGPTYP
jgi:hypothetical protein